MRFILGVLVGLVWAAVQIILHRVYGDISFVPFLVGELTGFGIAFCLVANLGIAAKA